VSSTFPLLRFSTISIFPGDLESSPVLKYVSSDQCELVLTWHTAAACPIKSVNGTNCMVSDEDSGLTFDLKRLSKPTNDVYKVNSYELK